MAAKSTIPSWIFKCEAKSKKKDRDNQDIADSEVQVPDIHIAIQSK